jgi:hypothetical protein
VVIAIVIILSVFIGGGPRSGSTTLRMDKMTTSTRRARSPGEEMATGGDAALRTTRWG